MITEWGIEANPVKIEAIRRMQPPTPKKRVQKLTGQLGSLNRFISRSAEKSLPFFKLLRVSENFSWGPKQDKAFEDLKRYLENLTVLTSPLPEAELLLYIATSHSALSAALVEERVAEGMLKQFPIYFVFEALSGSKLLYSEMEKLAYAVVMAARKLRHYFQSFKIKVPTSYPFWEASGRIGKWATQLAAHTIDFVPRSAIKSQVLADFIADWTPPAPSQKQLVIEAIWQLECGGAYYKNGSGASAVLTAPSGTQLKYAGRLDFAGCTNNMAEYEGLLLGLRKARALEARRLSIRSDSELITNHIGKTYRALKP